jgi:hypothetical protein
MKIEVIVLLWQETIQFIARFVGVIDWSDMGQSLVWSLFITFGRNYT